MSEQDFKKEPAIILRISVGDVVYVRGSASDKVFGFTLRQLEHYRGESMKELKKCGLMVGATVQISYNALNQIQTVSGGWHRAPKIRR